MRMMAVAGVLITLPAIVVALWGAATGRPFMMWAALASFGVNSLPFIIAMLLLRAQKQKGHKIEAH